VLPERGIPPGSDVPFVLNFNINKNGTNHMDYYFRDETRELIEWIEQAVSGWQARLQRASKKPASDMDDASSGTDSGTDVEDAPVIVRFWFCSMQAYDMFKPDLEELWELSDEYPLQSGEEVGETFIEMMDSRAKIECMFYERSDFIAYPNAAAIAGSMVLETYAVEDRWRAEDQAFRAARRVSRLHSYNEPDWVEDQQWWDLKRGLDDSGPESEKEACDESDYSEEEESEEEASEDEVSEEEASEDENDS
jgi:hypothetical protein